MIAFANSLSQFFADNLALHEAKAYGVPSSYSWAARPNRDQWNAVPDGFTSVLGWGQCFFAADAPQLDATIEIRNMRTYAKTAAGWALLQTGKTDGAMFWPDFHENLNEPPAAYVSDDVKTSVRLKFGRAYHWWPKARSTIPAGYEALLVLIEARAVDSDSMLIGLGADFWKSSSAPYPNNAGVGVGRFRKLTRNFETYGFTTASLQNLAEFSA
jgi:hypothetical protein